MPREFKRYELRSTRKPAKASVLSTTVSVQNENGESGYCYISFSYAFVVAVGKRLPRGVSDFDPAFIQARYNRQLQSWEIWARYFGDGKGVLLWATADRPSWLNFYKREAKDGNETPQDSSRNSDQGGSRTGAEKAGSSSSDSRKERPREAYAC